MPRVSVVMAVYNSERFLREAIDSILAQTYKDFDFIIIDDGSTDLSAQIIHSYVDKRIRYRLVEHKSGAKGAAAFNIGLEMVTGEYIARMDADDISLPQRLAIEVEYMDSHPEIAVCGSDYQVFGLEQRVVRFPRKPEENKAALLNNSCLCHPSVMMRSALFGVDGYEYDPSYGIMADYELWYRISQRFNIANITRVLHCYREHNKQGTYDIYENPIYLNDIRRLRTRQIEQLGLLAQGPEFEAFACKKINCDILMLMRFNEKIKSANRAVGVYDQKVLERQLDKIVYYSLQYKNLIQATKCVYAYDMNWLAYAVNRGWNGLVRRIRIALEALKSAERMRYIASLRATTSIELGGLNNAKG